MNKFETLQDKVGSVVNSIDPEHKMNVVVMDFKSHSEIHIQSKKFHDAEVIILIMNEHKSIQHKIPTILSPERLDEVVPVANLAAWIVRSLA